MVAGGVSRQTALMGLKGCRGKCDKYHQSLSLCHYCQPPTPLPHRITQISVTPTLQSALCNHLHIQKCKSWLVVATCVIERAALPSDTVHLVALSSSAPHQACTLPRKLIAEFHNKAGPAESPETLFRIILTLTAAQ